MDVLLITEELIMNRKIKPLGDRILVKRAKTQESKGGILLPETAKEKPKEGEVLAVGPGKTGDDGKVTPLSIVIGKRVLFGAYAGSAVKADGHEEYLVMSEDDVLATLN